MRTKAGFNSQIIHFRQAFIRCHSCLIALLAAMLALLVKFQFAPPLGRKSLLFPLIVRALP